MLYFISPFIVVMRARLQVFEASRHEASFKTVLPPIGAVAPVTSVPDICYAGVNKKPPPLCHSEAQAEESHAPCL